jgi:hypothetical protein
VQLFHRVDVIPVGTRVLSPKPLNDVFAMLVAAPGVCDNVHVHAEVREWRYCLYMHSLLAKMMEAVMITAFHLTSATFCFLNQFLTLSPDNPRDNCSRFLCRPMLPYILILSSSASSLLWAVATPPSPP